MSRPNWDKYFLKIAMLVSERSTCLRLKVGAVIVKNKQILATGYNGAGKGMKDCLELGCLKEDREVGKNYEECRSIHAEQNAIIQAAANGINISRATIYQTYSPCMLCAKMFVNLGVKRVVTYSAAVDKNAMALLKEAGIEYIRLPKPDTRINA